MQGDHSQDTVKFQDISRPTIRGIPALLSVTPIMLVLVLLSVIKI